jgi:hypothetical protein
LNVQDIAEYEQRNQRDEIVRLEAQIEALSARIENCRKFILAGRIATAAGGLVLIALLFGVILPDLTLMAGGMAAVLGGIVIWGSNSSTEKEAAEQMAAAESRRAALIGELDLHLVAERPTLH